MSALPSTAVVDNPWLAQTVRIESITPELAGVATYHLRFVDEQVQAGYQYQPGQFNMLYLPGAGEIAIGISRGGNGEGTWEHTVREAGIVTHTLARLEVGDTFGLRGPYGSAWPLESSAGADVLVVAGGTGLASLRAAIDAILGQRSQFGNLTLLYGARTPDTMLYHREFQEWSDGGMDIRLIVDRSIPGWTGDVGVVPLLLDRLKPLVPKHTIVFCCGPEVMMRYTLRSALARGLSENQIWLSLERNMQCAVGLCGHCQLGPSFICKDGPIYRYDKVEPYLNVEAL